MRGFKREDKRIRFLNLALALDARARREKKGGMGGGISV
jgi:hypothetical protein